MICKSCRSKTDDNDVYCLSCGIPLDKYKQQFNLKKIIKQTNDSAKSQKHTYFIYNIVLGILLTTSIIITKLSILTDNYVMNYIIQNILIILLVPFFMLQLVNIDNKHNVLLRNEVLKYYPRFFLFSFYTAIYFFFLKFLCEGFFISLPDPILNLVRLVLVLWGLAIILPVPMLLIKRNESVLSLIHKAFIAGKYLRWHQFSILMMLGTMSIVSCMMLFLFLPTNMRFNIHLLSIWYKKQEEYKLYDRNKDY